MNTGALRVGETDFADKATHGPEPSKGTTWSRSCMLSGTAECTGSSSKRSCTRCINGGLGRAVVEAVIRNARAAGCEWVHVDYEPHLESFYLDACGFQTTAAGLRRLV